MAQKLTMMGVLRNLLLGSGIVIATPLLAGFIPAIADLSIITVGQALSAGVSAFGVNWILDQFPALR